MKGSIALPFATAALGLIGICVPAQADPPPWAPAHGHRAKQVREYRYVYYPAQRVYYAPETHTWFWMSGGNWQFGINLPGQIRVDANLGGIPVTLQSSRPYVEHVYVETEYGRPWREKRHKKDKEEKHKHKHHKHGHGHDHADD
ncbi:MAG TPA: hypothetical protein VEC06_13480 [Paucimonas sp.]|nr:hypothetical protein [Paucimonas sp.]